MTLQAWSKVATPSSPVKINVFDGVVKVCSAISSNLATVFCKCDGEDIIVGYCVPDVPVRIRLEFSACREAVEFTCEGGNVRLSGVEDGYAKIHGGSEKRESVEIEAEPDAKRKKTDIPDAALPSLLEQLRERNRQVTEMEGETKKSEIPASEGETKKSKKERRRERERALALENAPEGETKEPEIPAPEGETKKSKKERRRERANALALENAPECETKESNSTNASLQKEAEEFTKTLLAGIVTEEGTETKKSKKERKRERQNAAALEKQVESTDEAKKSKTEAISESVNTPEETKKDVVTPKEPKKKEIVIKQTNKKEERETKTKDNNATVTDQEVGSISKKTAAKARKRKNRNARKAARKAAEAAQKEGAQSKTTADKAETSVATKENKPANAEEGKAEKKKDEEPVQNAAEATTAMKKKKKKSKEEKVDVVARRTTDNGVKIEITHPGNGAEAKIGKKVTVRYDGRLASNGNRFDKGSIPFRLGMGEVIRGWDEGVKGMLVGEKRKLLVPSTAGYGSQGAPPSIPPHSNLIFDVELLNVS